MASNLHQKWANGYHAKDEHSAVAHVRRHVVDNLCKMCTLQPNRRQLHLVTQFTITGAEMETDKENLWTLVVEVYSAFSKSDFILVNRMIFLCYILM